jgi:hypothetical protein
MALTLVCDGGCHCPIPVDTVPVGRLAPVFYCAEGRATWTDAEARIEASRQSAVEAFTLARDTILAEARAKLTRLPDE